MIPPVIATKHPRRSASLIDAGDTFVFNGLVGDATLQTDERLITVLGISVIGDLQIRIEWVPPADEPAIRSLPYDLALQMIEEQIWQEVHAAMTKPTVRAIDLTRQHLLHIVTVTDHTGEQVTGLLHRFELDADPRTRVQVRVATQEPTESGGSYWSTFSDCLFLNPDAPVEVGELVPDWRPE